MTSPQTKNSFANAFPIDELSLSNVILYFNLDFEAIIEKQHINKADLFYKSLNDSAKLAVYLSSS